MPRTLPVAVSLLLALAVSAGGATDLMDVYQLSLQSDPLIREAEATRLATLESKPQARAALLPQLDVAGSYNERESDGSTTFLQIPAIGLPPVTVTSGFETDADFWQYQLRLTQTVFRWDQWVALRRADSQVAQAEVDYRAAGQDLMFRVSQRYFEVLASQDTLDAAEATLEAVARQLEQAEKRFEVGLIAITDVQEAKAAHDQAVAGVIAAKRTLATNQELLRELTGELFRELEAPGPDLPLSSPDPENEEDWVNTALEQNLRLISSRLAADIARENVRSARTGHYPALDLVLTRQEFDQNSTQTNISDAGRFTGPSDQDSTQDTISLQVTFPIFSGGGTSSRVREQVYLHRAARERLERTARETEREARDAYLGVLSEISRVQALRQALESTRTALQATEAGFEVGTRTTVDVLDARRRLFEAQTAFARSRYDYLLNVIRLKQASGSLGVPDLEQISSWLE